MGRGRGWARSEITRHRESLTLYKSFNTLCLYASLIKLEIRRMYVNRNKGASKTGSGEAFLGLNFYRLVRSFETRSLIGQYSSKASP
jgi:hypothetical protein